MPEWTSELEAELPEELQNWSRFAVKGQELKLAPVNGDVVFARDRHAVNPLRSFCVVASVLPGSLWYACQPDSPAVFWAVAIHLPTPQGGRGARFAAPAPISSG